MIYINAIIFGIIQGLTEFLPVSSSGHLVVLHRLIDLPVSDALTFDVALHLSTLLAVTWFFRDDIVKLFISWIKSLGGRNDEYSRLAWFILLATVPAVLTGFFFEDLIESTLRSPLVVIFTLIFVGVLLIIFERVSRKKDESIELSWQKSLVIGIAQAFSLIPGVSRSGITIIAGLGAGLKREAAIRLSFLLSVPIILGASIKKIPQSFGTFSFGQESLVLLVAFLSSFFVGILAIKYFLKFARVYRLDVFAYYRFALAILIAVLLFYGN